MQRSAGSASGGGRKETSAQAEVGAHLCAPLRTPPSRRPGWHVARPTEPDAVDHPRPPEPTAQRLSSQLGARDRKSVV